MPATPASPPIGMLRIASLLPAATEWICALGLGESLVGVSHECDWPPGLPELPVLTASRLDDAEQASGAIDSDVRRLLREALAVYDVDIRALADARPDVIVTQDLCDVCAVSFADVERAAGQLTCPDVKIVNLGPRQLGDIWNDLRTLSSALDRGHEGRALQAKLAARIERVRARTERLERRPTTLTIEWLDPVMIGGTWMPELVEIAGGRPLETAAGEPAPTLNAEALAALDPAPEVVLIKPCGYSIERTLNEVPALRTLLSGFIWPAVRDGRVWIADGNAYFNRPGPRIVDSLEILAACLHPQEFEDFARTYRSCRFLLEL